MPHFELLFTQDFANATDEVERLGGRVSQKFTDTVFEVMLRESADPAFAGQSFDLAALEHCATDPGFALDEDSQAIVTAWRRLQTRQSSGPADAVQASEPAPEGYDQGFKPSSIISPPATSRAMTGTVLVEPYCISGPGTWGFNEGEKFECWVATVDACRYLVAVADYEAKLSFHWSQRFETVNIEAHGTACQTVESCEKVWLDPVLAVWRRSGINSVSDMVRHLQATYKTNWAYIIFYHKYPMAQSLAGYLGRSGDYVAIQYTYWWFIKYGFLNLATVVAHESCHVFGAADEYNFGAISCDCEPSGFRRVPNNNCVRCTYQPKEDCLMGYGYNPTSSGTLSLNLCKWSRGQIGWGYWLKVEAPPLMDIGAASDGTVWGVTTSQGIVRLENSKWVSVFGSLTSISVANGQIWGANSLGNVFQFVNNGWVKDAGTTSITQISVANDGTIYGITGVSGIYLRGSSGTWYPIPGQLYGVTVGSVSDIWGINMNRHPTVLRDGVWQVPNQATIDAISVASDGTLWGINGGAAWQYSRGPNRWDRPHLDSSLGSLVKIANGGKSHIWAINSSGGVFRRAALVQS